MDSMHGSPRLLTDAQVQMILAWWPKRLEWKERRALLLRKKRALAAQLGVCNHTIDRTIALGPHWRPSHPALRRRGRVPLIRTPADLALIHAWHAEWVALHAEGEPAKSMQELGEELGVADSTIQRAIRLRGIYKQVSPERFREVRVKRERRLARMRALFLY